MAVRETGVSQVNHVYPIEDTPEIPRTTSQHYRIEDTP